MLVFAISDVLLISVLGPITSCAAALLIGWQLNRQLRSQKLADNERTDEVAQKAEIARIELSKEDEQKRADAKQVAEVVTEVARQLAMAQEQTIAGTDEVARVAARGGDSNPGSPSSKQYGASLSGLLTVIISHPSGYRREVLLDGIPSKGDYILLKGAEPDSQPMVVADYPLWIESNGQSSPSVIIIVTPRTTEILGKSMKKAVAKEEANQKQEVDG